jgi:hypothetical protein
MNTQTAAAKAYRSASTIRTWCRRNIIAAVKTARGWDIDKTSLDHRIALSAKPAPVTLTERAGGRHLGVHGPANLLAAAFNTQQQVTITAGPFTGEKVHLGYTPYFGGDTTGLDYTNTDGTAIYYINVDTLHEGAPTLCDAYWQGMSDVITDYRQTNADEDEYLNPRYM